jgi:hypothetical protein
MMNELPVVTTESGMSVEMQRDGGLKFWIKKSASIHIQSKSHADADIERAMDRGWDLCDKKLTEQIEADAEIKIVKKQG